MKAKKFRWRVTIYYFDPKTKQIDSTEVMKTPPITQEEWENKTFPERMLKAADMAKLEGKKYCCYIDFHKDKTIVRTVDEKS